MEIGPSSSSYKISVIHHHTRKSCAKTWRFAYGISEITHKRATGRRKNSKKKQQQQKVPKKHFRPVSEADQTKTARNAWHSLHIRTIQNPKAQQQHQIAS